MVCRDMADLVSEREGELGFIVHQAEQLPSDVNIAARDRKSVLDGGVERGEVQRLGGIGDAGLSANAPSYGFDISGPRPGFGAAQLLDHCRIFALRLGDIAGVQIAQALRGRGSHGRRRRGKQQDRLIHDSHPNPHSGQNKRGDFERGMKRVVSGPQPMARNLARRCARSSSGPSRPQPSSSSTKAPLRAPIAASGSR